ncbi:Pyridoxal phosphate-dependent transferase, major domain [Sesbania bispinosa]|nr:Pyridoxal phosphate-dependent transferase, major domain [Sesbania bispinosa]
MDPQPGLSLVSNSTLPSENSEGEQEEQSQPMNRFLMGSWANQPLGVADPEVHAIMEREKQRQFKKIELIASKNFVCKAMMEALPYSFTSGNFAFASVLQPEDRIMGLDSFSRGHLSQGYYSQSGKTVSTASIFFETLSYKVDPQTWYVVEGCILESGTIGGLGKLLINVKQF